MDQQYRASKVRKKCLQRVLRLPHRNDGKIAEICNLWIFLRVIHPINHSVLDELQAETSRGCRFLLFWHHSYEVTLRYGKGD